jgi:hypothetical protein
MERNYGGVVWTNHAIERMQERGIKQGDAWATFRSPDQSRYARAKGAWVYYKTWGGTRIEVVAKEESSKPTGKKEWIILSVWSGARNTSKAKTRPKSSNSFLKSLTSWLKKV